MSLVLLCLLWVFAFAVVIPLAKQWRRREDLRATAARLGFAFMPSHPELEAMLPEVARFGEFATRHRAWNALRGVWNSVELVLFDHEFRMRDGGHPHRRTTALFLAPNAGLPDFEMLPELPGAGLGQDLIDGQIDLPDAPRLDARISLCGQPPDAVRAFFSGARARALGRQPLSLAIRSGDGWLAVYRDDGMAEAAELQDFLDEATALAEVILGPQAAGTPPPLP